MTKKITIAIDGFSSTGKSTIAKQLAQYLGYVYVDTGAMYRAVAYYAMQQRMIDAKQFDVENLVWNLDKIKISFKYNPELGYSETYLNNENVEQEIRTIAVSNYVSRIAEISEIRAKLVQQQQEMGKEKGLVMDGRDIGTVVFPDAELKLFITSDPNIRAQRRYQELLAKDDSITFEEVLANVTQRDYIDTHRKDSPLVKAADAIEIDNSHMSKDEQFAKIVGLVKELL
ncbi:MAG TPA: (d)CMP kinase [Flavobacterium sp.]|nr:(d)CMP kinase [Flavobacterium sp.]